MTHLDDGQLLTLRDDPSSAAAEDRAHAGSCPRCREALDAVRHQSDAVADALAALDHGAWDLHDARERVRDRVTREAARAAGAVPLAARRTRRAAWTLSRAAGLVLLTGAGLSALPGSPVRSWIQDRMGGADAAPTPAAVEAAPAPEAPEAVGVRVPVAAGPLTVTLRGAEAGTEVRVRWIPAREAAVLAPVGSRFTSGPGRVEATLAPGVVRVELPEGLVPVSLEVDGRAFLRVTASGMEVTGPAVSRSPAGVVFRVPPS